MNGKANYKAEARNEKEVGSRGSLARFWVAVAFIVNMSGLVLVWWCKRQSCMWDSSVFFNVLD